MSVQVGTTKVIDDNLDPQWNEDMPLRVPIETKNSLVIQVFDYDSVGEHEFLGQVDFYGLSDDALPIYETEYKLECRTNPGTVRRRVEVAKICVLYCTVFDRLSRRAIVGSALEDDSA